MSVRKERFCDLMVEGKPDSLLIIPKPTECCKQPAIDTCFFCKRDYCQEHEQKYREVKLELSGFKESLSKVLPVCKDCGKDRLPYNPEVLVLKHFERCWRAIKRNIRAEKKAQREKQRAQSEKRKNVQQD